MTTMTTRHKLSLNTASLVVLAVLFVAVIMLSNVLFRGLRIDLTENQLYTISDGTKAILEDIDEPINLYFFFSQEASRENPFLRDYAQRVREFVEEFAARSDGKLQLSIVDPVRGETLRKKSRQQCIAPYDHRFPFYVSLVFQ